MREVFLRFYKMGMLAVFLCLMGLVVNSMNVFAITEDEMLQPNTWEKYTIEYEFLTAKENEITCQIYETEAADSDGGMIYTIPSNLIKITVDNVVISPENYVISVEENQETPGSWYLTGIWNVWGYADSQYSLQTFFEGKDNLPTIKEAGPPALDDLSYWDITIDSSDCSFAQGYDPKPKVTIQSIDGTVILEENVDFTVDVDVKEGTEKKCGSDNRLQIYWKEESTKCSNVTASKGYIEQKYTIHYANIADYYDLEGVPETIPFSGYSSGSMPKLKSKSNGNDAGMIDLDSLDGFLYLKPKENKNLGALPSFNHELQTMPAALWNAAGCLTVSYQYDGSTWENTFDMEKWAKWRQTHDSDTVLVKVSVNESKGNYYQINDTAYCVARLLTGSIIKEVRILPYSLEEINPSGYPPTESVDGTNIFARINPEPIAHPEIKDVYSNVEEKAINVVYNGQKQEPVFAIGMYIYSNRGLGGVTMAASDYIVETSVDDPAISGLIESIRYSDNINAGTGTITITFKELFTGSIKRHFTIQPKSIADSSIEVQVDDDTLRYTGEQLLPKLTVKDTAIGTVLKEGEDYKVEVVSGGVEPGAASLKLTGINNYAGERLNISYEIPEEEVFVSVRKKHSLRLAWQKNPGYQGYEVYMATKKNGEFKQIAVVEKNTAAVRNLKVGKTYYFKVRAYKNVNGQKEYTPFSEVMATSTKLTKSHITSVKSSKKGQVTLKWKKDKKASGYRIFVKKAGVTKFQLVKDITDNQKKSYTIKGLKPGKTITVRIRSYKTVNGEKVYSSFSKKIKVRVKG